MVYLAQNANDFGWDGLSVAGGNWQVMQSAFARYIVFQIDLV